MRVSRRSALAGMLAAGASAFARGASADARSAADPSAPRAEDFDVLDISVEGDRALGRRFTLLVPRHLAAGERVPLLVLLHGLGETGDERLGVNAWLERYGLGSSYERLRRAPLEPTLKRDYLGPARLAELNASLQSRPFRGLAIACPFTPNVSRAPMGLAAALDGYTRWITEVVVPRARKEAPVHADAARTTIDGCSLGGYVGLEVFLRRPELFGAWGGVQSAFGRHRASGYAERIASALAAVGARDLHIETSTADPFREANELLAKGLAARGVQHDLRLGVGPHDQPWLREVGTLEMLLWHDRRPR